MRVDILSLFPGYFRGPFDESMIRRARESGLLDIHLHDIRDWASGRHSQVDDRPYGGGPGMVMMPEPVVGALRAVKTEKAHTVYLSPQGSVLNASKARELAKHEHIVFLCGHYEGVDQRALDLEVDEELSIGDFVLTNGCLPAIVALDVLMRFLPGSLGDPRAANEDSFESGLLDWPHFTRPENFEGRLVPEELLRGKHQEIDAWRLAAAEEKTRRVRPELYAAYKARHHSKGKVLQGPKLHCITLPVKNIRKCRQFYSYLLGLEELSRDASSVSYALQGLELVFYRGEPRPGPSMLMEVDVQASLERMEKALFPHRPVWEGELLKSIYCSDVDGYSWELI